MKKFLSLLICVMLVMSSMATVAFADVAEITFGAYLAQLPAGSKIIVNTGDVAEGNTVVATINGVESPLVKADGYYSVTVPAGDNRISVAVKNGDEVVAQTATISVFGLSYLGEGNRVVDATFEPDSTTNFGYSDFGMKDTWYQSVTGLKADGTAGTKGATMTTVDGNTYLGIGVWGTAISDPNTGAGYVKKAGSGIELAAANVGKNNASNVTKFSMDYRFDSIVGVDAGGNVTGTYPMRTSEEIMAAAKAGGTSSVLSSPTLMTIQHYYDDTMDSDGNGNTTEELRAHINYWILDLGTGKPMFAPFNEDGSRRTFRVDNFNEGWNTYSVIIDVPNDTAYGFINDIYVGSGRLAAVQLKNQSNSENNNKWVPVTSKSAIWPSIGQLKPATSSNAVGYSSADNFFVDSYNSGFAPTNPAIEVINGISETTLPEGTKMKINVNAANIPAGGRVVAFVNGVETALTPVGSSYKYDAPIAEGYTSISVAMLDANGDVVVYDGEELASDEWTYYAFGVSGDTYVGLDVDFEDGLKEGTIYPETNNGIGDEKWSGYWTKKQLHMKKDSDGNNYIQASSWSSAEYDPNPEVDGYTKVKDAANKPVACKPNRISNENDPNSIQPNFVVDMSADFRFDKFHVKVDGDIKELPATKAVFDTYKGKLYGDTTILALNLYRADRDDLTKYDAFPTFVVNTNGYRAVWYTAGGQKHEEPLDLDPTQWHTFRTVLDGATDKVYLYVDGEFVGSGYAAQNFAKTAYADVTGWAYPYFGASRIFDNDTYACAIFQSWDNLSIVEHKAGANAAPTEAVVNAAITATNASLGIIPANLGLADEEEIDIAVIAKTAAGVEIQKYEGVTNASAYKAFGFDMADIDKVFVWNWETLAPIAEVIE